MIAKIKFKHRIRYQRPRKHKNRHITTLCAVKNVKRTYLRRYFVRHIGFPPFWIFKGHF
jgi:hypothetical protein